MNKIYFDRREAGAILAENLKEFYHSNAIILGLPRGGVPVAAEIALKLDLFLDVIIAHKLGAPGNPEAAIGAVAEGGAVFLDPYLPGFNLPAGYLEKEIAFQQERIQNNLQLFRQGRRLSEFGLVGRTVIVVDDGIATGATLQAALKAIVEQKPVKVVVAAPVAPPEMTLFLQNQGFLVVCPLQPEFLRAVGLWYKDFSPVDNDRVINILSSLRSRWSK